MGDGGKVCCLLCQRSEETKITGALSTKDEVTAHQNCLLFSSGLYCQSSPEFDDLFGFSVKAVLTEVKRGYKLKCSKCKKRGATVGCEVKRCMKSYHYPCALSAETRIIEDTKEEKYVLYCHIHDPQAQENLVNGQTDSSSSTSKNSREAGPSKVYCLACEKTEGHICLESLSNSIVLFYCDKHAPASQKRNSSGGSAARQLSLYSSDSNSSGSTPRSSSKKRSNSSDKPEGTPSKRRTAIETDDSSESVGNGPDSGMAMFAPIETDIDESVNSVTDSQFTRNNTESPTGSASGNHLEGKNRDEDETFIESDAESESLLLLPVLVQSVSSSASAASSKAATTLPTKKKGEVVQSKDEEHTPGPSVPHQSSVGPPSSPDYFKPHRVPGSPPCTSSPASPEIICVSLLSPPSSPPVAPPSDPEPSINSIKFWRKCNAAGCTQAIFTAFITEMNDISSRIQSDQASQEDYDLALSVMTASGKLAELVSKQQEELERKQVELKKAAAAMKEVVSALRR